ncbi:MAG TPA: dihydrolipoamide acetyltransferase family protein [Nannocystaceae bacterium]|nr:dihydrolipoamide acetyltransferase family protein [Nannocystaceae bacterium]
MATVVSLPRLSDTMEEGVIAKWHVAPGDKVKRGQVIAEIETDKATMEFESFDAGVVLELVASEGQTLPIGAPIAVFGQAGEDPKAALAGGAAKPAAAEKPAAEKPAAEKPAAAKPAEAKPAAAKPAPEPPAAAKPAASNGSNGAARPQRDDGRIAASPLARRLAREHGLELGEIEGSGPHGRVIKDDVERAAQKPRTTTTATAPVGDTVMKLSQMRKAIARRMAQANAEIPHFYLTIAIDMKRSVALREELAASEIKISFNDLVLFACARALEKHPEINAFWNGETIVRRGEIHLGIAVALDEGLIVPVVRNADRKSMRQLAAESRDLGTRARDKKLDPAEMTGSTFTVSNLGMFGIEAFAAVVNPGEGAILAVGGIADEPVVEDGKLVPGKRMRVTLSCDHRVMDGAMGARFLATLRGLLEHPLTMLA